MAQEIGLIKGVNGPVVKVKNVENARMLEVVEVGEHHLIGEIVRLNGTEAIVQVYEDTTGLKPGDKVYGSGMPLSLELGPGLLRSIYDGIERPLTAIREKYGNYIQKGSRIPALDHAKLWKFTPAVKKGETVTPGQIIGSVQETESVEHRILIQPDAEAGELVEIVPPGDYNIDKVVATVKGKNGTFDVKMFQVWAIREPRPIKTRMGSVIPMITGQRVIDTLFPISKGGTSIVPGGFGTGKTMVQHALAKWSDVDIIIYVGCGERGNEMTDVLLSFPELIDPRSGKSLMGRTVLIANISNMPVAAREASIYTGITIAEYYRDMGYDVAVMADSTSRWAEALRELSGRMEEMPADEGFPSYLPTRLAQFYERAGATETLCGKHGTISIIGAVSPPGGDFSEPVTQHSKRFVRCFWALDRQLANSRHYPAISWVDSYSEYLPEVTPWWSKNVDPKWIEYRTFMMDLLQKEVKLQQVVKLVGPDTLPDSQKLILEICRLFKNAFLQQNAYDKIDMFTIPIKQFKMLEVVVEFYKKGQDLVKGGWTVTQLRAHALFTTITQMKYQISNEEYKKLDEIIQQIRNMA